MQIQFNYLVNTQNTANKNDHKLEMAECQAEPGLSKLAEELSSISSREVFNKDKEIDKINGVPVQSDNQ